MWGFVGVGVRLDSVRMRVWAALTWVVGIVFWGNGIGRLMILAVRVVRELEMLKLRYRWCGCVVK